MCCDHLVEIYTNYDMKKYNFEDMVSNAYIFAYEYADKHVSYPEKIKSHKFFVEKAMEKSLAKHIEKSNELEVVPTCEIDEYSEFGCSKN